MYRNLEIEQEWRIVGASVPVTLCGAVGWAAATMVAAPRGLCNTDCLVVLHVAHSVKPTDVPSYPPCPLPTRLLDLIGGSLVLGVTVDRVANGAE